LRRRECWMGSRSSRGQEGRFAPDADAAVVEVR
jgi:hypothetical protein